MFWTNLTISLTILSTVLSILSLYWYWNNSRAIWYITEINRIFKIIYTEKLDEDIIMSRKRAKLRYSELLITFNILQTVPNNIFLDNEIYYRSQVNIDGITLVHNFNTPIEKENNYSCKVIIPYWSKSWVKNENLKNYKICLVWSSIENEFEIIKDNISLTFKWMIMLSEPDRETFEIVNGRIASDNRDLDYILKEDNSPIPTGAIKILNKESRKKNKVMYWSGEIKRVSWFRTNKNLLSCFMFGIGYSFGGKPTSNQNKIFINKDMRKKSIKRWLLLKSAKRKGYLIEFK